MITANSAHQSSGRRPASGRLPGRAAACALLLSLAASGCADLSDPAQGTEAVAPELAAQTAELPASKPLSLSIPDAGISSRIIALGLNKDRTVAVPPIMKNDPVSWYKHSPTPGEKGPSVLLGHVTVGRYGAGVFKRLPSVKPGDSVLVTRADKTVAHFKVDKVKKFSKAKFPTQQVYGNTPNAQLRLITCAGELNARGEYPDNVIVFATLTSRSP